MGEQRSRIGRRFVCCCALSLSGAMIFKAATLSDEKKPLSLSLSLFSLTSMSSRRKPSASLPASKERLSPASPPPPPPSLPADFLPLVAEGSTPTHCSDFFEFIDV